MWRGLFALFTFIPVGMWEFHASGFAPWWLQAAPIWPWFVVALCLEVDESRLISGLSIAGAWMTVVASHAFWRVMVLAASILFAYGILRTWLSHRSMWSALALVFFGRLFFAITDLFCFWWQDAWGVVQWDMVFQSFFTRCAWDALLVIVGLRCTIGMRKRLQPYIASPSRLV